MHICCFEFWKIGAPLNNFSPEQILSPSLHADGLWIPAVPSPACWCPCCSFWSQVARTTARPRFKPGWMTSPFCLGFLYDPGISHFPQQTSASSRGEHSSPAPSARSNTRTRHTHLEKGSDSRHRIYSGAERDCSLCFKPSFDSTHGGQPCLRCCHTARGKWAATGRTARSARCPLAAGCRTQAPFSPPRRRRDHQSSDRSAEPSEVKTRKDGRIRNINAIFTSTYEKKQNKNNTLRCQAANE